VWGAACLVALLALGAGATAAGSESQIAGGGTPAEPVVTLNLRVTGVSVATTAKVTITGTFRARAQAGRQTYGLRPVAGGVATHRHGTAAAQRARVERVSLDVRSGSEFLKVTGSGSLTGGPTIAGRGRVCRRIVFEYTANTKARAAVLRWACRPAGAEGSPPIHVDVLRQPRDTIVSSHTITRQPCSPAPAGEDRHRHSATEVGGAC
jgi:hypothetical protein